MKFRRYTGTSNIALAVGLALGLGANAAHAQEADEKSELRLEEIIVTAQKRSESLQDVAISITAITSETLDDFQIRDFGDYLRLVPGLSAALQSKGDMAGPRTVGLRGVQSISGSYLAGQNTVGFYIDNTPVPIANPRLLDLERVEVLRGPQGTLYGASALAGAIKVITRKPSYENFEAQAMAEISNTRYGGTNWEVEGLVNLPISDRFAIRLSAYYEEIDGYVDMHEIDLYANPTGNILKDINTSEVVGGRLVAAFQATDNFQITATLMMEDTKVGSSNYVHVPNAGGRPDSPVGLAYQAAGIGAPNYAPLDGSADDAFKDPIILGHFPTPTSNDYMLATIEFDWDLGNFQVVSNTSYWEDSYRAFLDGTETYGLIIDQGAREFSALYNDDNEEWTHETRLVTTWDKPLQFTVGFFHTSRKELYWTPFFGGVGNTYGAGIFPGGGIFPDGWLFWAEADHRRKETALFGQASYDFNDKFRAVVGARVFKFDFTTNDHFRGHELFVTNNEVILDGATDAQDWVPSFKLEYRPDDDTLVYASAAEGFRMGGANFPLPRTPECEAEVFARTGNNFLPDAFDSDSLWNYELGLKKVWADGRVTTNFAVYAIDWTGTQVSTGGLCGLSGAVINVGSVETQGVEGEIHIAATERLTISAAASYVDSKIAEDFTPPGSTLPPFALKGEPLPYIPEWSGNILAQYVFPIGDMEGFVRGEYSYRPKTDNAVFGRQGNYISADAYALLNLRAGVMLGKWEVSAFVNNATNEDPSLLGRPLVTAVQGWRYMDYTLTPRTYGVTARWRY